MFKINRTLPDEKAIEWLDRSIQLEIAELM
jgi:hypothetical protein